MADQQPATPETVAVYARVRGGPDSTNEISVVPETPEKIRATGATGTNYEFHLDRGFDTTATQEELFVAVGSKLVDSVVSGYNACIIAYGQTGSGKTFTMLGPEGAKLDGSGGVEAGLGVVPRACLQLFKLLPSGFTVTAAYMEVYNDAVNDCLRSDGDSAKYLALRETAPGHIEPDGLTRVPVKNTADVMAAVSRGDSKRVVAAMAMNPRSSRGHGIISIEVKNANGEQHGRLTLVDLAGMESSKKSFAVEGASNNKTRQEEAKRINMSLLALSGVINALASKGQTRVPFRDSKLTRLLQSSLAGNCKAAVIVTLRSEKKNVEEAINTLRFAQRAKAVSATVMKNEDARKPTGAAAHNKKLASELNSAKESLAQYQDKLSKEGVVQEELRLQVKSLLSQMQELQDQDVQQKAITATASASVSLEERVRVLEARNAQLEEENRILKQRDIMHRVIQIEGGGNDATDSYQTTFQTMGFASTVASPELGEVELRRDSKVQRVRDRTSNQAQPLWNTGREAPRSKWVVVRAYVRLTGKKSAKVAPAGSGKRRPPKKLWRPDLMSKQELAAVTIQKHARRFLVVKELDSWDAYFESAWDQWYGDEDYGY